MSRKMTKAEEALLTQHGFVEETTYGARGTTVRHGWSYDNFYVVKDEKDKFRAHETAYSPYLYEKERESLQTQDLQEAIDFAISLREKTVPEIEITHELVYASKEQVSWGRERTIELTFEITMKNLKNGEVFSFKRKVPVEHTTGFKSHDFGKFLERYEK